MVELSNKLEFTGDSELVQLMDERKFLEEGFGFGPVQHPTTGN